MKRIADLTVITPNYNHGHFLPEYFDAIFSQSSIPKQLLIIDDASTDRSVEVIQNFQTLYPQIQLIQNATNQGPFHSANRAIEEATGTYLAFLSADDLVLPGFFEQGTACLDAYPEAGICCSDPTFFEDKKPYLFKRKKLLPKKSHMDSNQVLEIRPSDFIKYFLFSPIWIASHASLFRKKFVIQHQNFPPGLLHLADWFFNLRLAIFHGIVYVPTTFGAFRLSPNSYGAKLNSNFIKKASIYRQLFILLSHQPKFFRDLFRKSGVLGLISSDILLYILFHPPLWRYFPNALFRKTCNFIRKIKS